MTAPQSPESGPDETEDYWKKDCKGKRGKVVDILLGIRDEGLLLEEERKMEGSQYTVGFKTGIR